MVKYRLTKKGKTVIVLLCTFMMLSVTLGVSISKDKPLSADYNKADAVQSKPATASQALPPVTAKPQQKNADIDAELLDKLKVSIFFDANTVKASSRDDEGMDAFLKAAAQYEDQKIQVEGNCATVFDNDKTKGQKSANYNLSLLRAETIAAYLKDKGISPDRLVVVANGSDKPLKDNNTPAGREYNRRVDVFFLSK